MKRVIQRNLQNPLATMILEGKIADGDTVIISAAERGLVINGTEFSAEAGSIPARDRAAQSAALH